MKKQLPSSSYRCKVVPFVSKIGEVVSAATVALFFSFLVDSKYASAPTGRIALQRIE